MNTTLEYVFRTALGQCSTIPMSDPAVDQLHQGGAYDYSHPGRLDNNGGVRDGAPYHHQNLHNTNNNNPWNDDTTPLMNNDGVVAHTNNSNHPTPINRGKQASNRASGARGVMVGGGGGKLPKDLNMHKLFGAVKQTIGGGGGGNNNNNIHGGGAYGVSTLSPTTSTSPRTVVLPPESAIRTRCYRLNLNTDIIIPTPTTANNGGGMSSSTASPVQVSTSGPYRCDSHAALGDRTVDLSSAYVGFSPSLDDSIADDHRDTVASTARIFRGLTVNHDGSIVSHHHRSSKGSTGPKRDEKSRQSTKIDQAVDMAEEAVRKGTTTTTKPTNTLSSGSKDDAESENRMISLVIFGEYDDMKGLVRDGAKRLKENQNALDEALWALNKTRITHTNNLLMSNSNSWDPLVSSPNYHSRGGRTNHVGSANAVMITSNVNNNNNSNNMSSGSNVSKMTPPKLHRHPRDRPGSTVRREMARNASNNNTSSRGGKGFPPWKMKNAEDGTYNGGAESDWSDALLFSKGLYSMCVCGANSASPTSNGNAATNATTTSGAHHHNSNMNHHHPNSNVNIGHGMVNTNNGNNIVVATREGRDALPVVPNNYKGRYGSAAGDGRESAYYNRAKDSIMV